MELLRVHLPQRGSAAPSMRRMRHGEGGVETPSIVLYDVELIVEEGGGRIIVPNNPENTSIAIHALPRTIQSDNAAEAEAKS